LIYELIMSGGINRKGERNERYEGKEEEERMNI
jgi:hypothetical protein